MNDVVNSNDCSIIRLIKSHFARCDNDTKLKAVNERRKKHTLNLNFLKDEPARCVLCVLMGCVEIFEAFLFPNLSYKTFY